MRLPYIECIKYSGEPRTNLDLGITGCEDFEVSERDCLVKIVGTDIGDLLIGIILADGGYTPENMMSMIKLMVIEKQCMVEPIVWKTLKSKIKSGFKSNMIANPFFDRRGRNLIVEKKRQLNTG